MCREESLCPSFLMSRSTWSGLLVHGKYEQPCPASASPIQRILFADRETNDCATCQTDGKLLRDRALSQLLKKDWPENLEELAAMKRW